MGRSDDLALAIELHRQGHVVDAAKLYRQILQRNPKCSRSLYLLGITKLLLVNFSAWLT